MSELIGSGRGSGVRPVAGEVVVTADDIGAFLEQTAGAEPAGAEIEEQSDEDDSVSLEGFQDGSVEEDGSDDIVYELAVAAASSGREFDGRVLAELLEAGGAIEDVRLSIAIEVLRLGQKLTGDRMLRVLESLGFAGEALAGRLAREEIASAGGVVVESTTAMPAGVES